MREGRQISYIRGLVALLLSAMLLPAVTTEAQILDRIKRRAKQTVERKAEEKTEVVVDGALDIAEEAVVCLLTDETCIEQAQEEGREVVLTDEEGNVVPDPAEPVDVQTTPGSVPAKPGEGVWANYDFVPGERVIFYDDFAREFVGDFPRRLEFVNGNWEIVEWQGLRLLRNTGPRHAAVKVPLPENLPDRFTIEFDVHFPHGNQYLALATSVPEQNRISLETGNYIQIGANGTGLAVVGEGVEALNRVSGTIDAALAAIRIMVDGTYAKIYVNERRVANVPNASIPRSNVLWLENTYMATEEYPMYVGPIRVAAGGRQMMYDQLLEDGKVVTQGILFDTGSATIRPESTPTLKDMGRMLQEHPDLRLRIEGHTDNTGTPETNLTLSQNRADAVKEFLVAEYGVDADRLESTGEGQNVPIAPNDTPEGRQSNRRVELVRLDG